MAVRCDWTAPASSGSTAIVEYIIERKTGTGAWTVIGTASDTARTYTDTTPLGGTLYEYRVFARNSVGRSDDPTPVSITTAATAPQKTNINGWEL